VPHGNLYGVTATLRELLRVNVWRLSNQEVTVSDLPPEEAEKQTGTRLNLHLYHAAEDPSRRNEMPRGDVGAFPISRTPMPLTLYYALTAHSVADNIADPKQQQFLMGLGMKSMHDFPLVDDTLMLPAPPAGTPAKILDPAMRGGQNRITIVQRQLSPEDTVTFWAAAQHHTARLTAYYEVRSLLLPPEPETEKPPLVGVVALGAMPSPRPTLLSATSVQTMTLPAVSGGQTLSAPLTPAVAALGATAAPAGNRVTATGEGLGDGTDGVLLIGGGALDAEAVLDPTYNPPWQIVFTGDSLAFTILPTLAATTVGGSAILTIRPGFYTLGVRRMKVLTTERGATSLGAMESNRIPFAVGAAIESAAVVARGRIRLTLRDGVDCTDPLNVPQLAIGGDVYRLIPAFANDASDQGRFIAQGAHRYDIQPLFDPADGATRIVRLAVNGVDAPPFWLEP
jgi:hypothetical protein